MFYEIGKIRNINFYYCLLATFIIAHHGKINFAVKCDRNSCEARKTCEPNATGLRFFNNGSQLVKGRETANQEAYFRNLGAA